MKTLQQGHLDCQHCCATTHLYRAAVGQHQQYPYYWCWHQCPSFWQSQGGRCQEVPQTRAQQHHQPDQQSRRHETLCNFNATLYWASSGTSLHSIGTAMRPTTVPLAAAAAPPSPASACICRKPELPPAGQVLQVAKMEVGEKYPLHKWSASSYV